MVAMLRTHPPHCIRILNMSSGSKSVGAPPIPCHCTNMSSRSATIGARNLFLRKWDGNLENVMHRLLLSLQNNIQLSLKKTNKPPSGQEVKLLLSLQWLGEKENVNFSAFLEVVFPETIQQIRFGEDWRKPWGFQEVCECITMLCGRAERGMHPRPQLEVGNLAVWGEKPGSKAALL